MQHRRLAVVAVATVRNEFFGREKGREKERLYNQNFAPANLKVLARAILSSAKREIG